MLLKLITIFLFSYSLLAQAIEQDVSPVAQSDLVSHVQNKQFDAEKDLADADMDDLQQDEVLFGVEPQKHINVASQKAYADLVSVMPQLAHASASVNQKDSNETKEDINSVILKFASMPRMRSSIVVIYDENGKQALHSKNADVVAPIASITKLMTAMVVLDANLPLDEKISISTQDVNKQKRSRSRTRIGMTLTRGELLKLALMASDNLSAAALARTYPGGTAAALAQMNAKARELGMDSSHFMDPTGLDSANVSTANDLVKMVSAAQGYELIHRFTTSTSHTVEVSGRKPLRFHNTNPLVKNTSWEIGLSKTGYISEAGRCLVMEAKISEHPVIIVLLDSWGKNSRVADAVRVKHWMENASVRGARESKNM